MKMMIQKSESIDCAGIFINFISCYYLDYIYVENFTGKSSPSAA